MSVAVKVRRSIMLIPPPIPRRVPWSSWLPSGGLGPLVPELLRGPSAGAESASSLRHRPPSQYSLRPTTECARRSQRRRHPAPRSARRTISCVRSDWHWRCPLENVARGRTSPTCHIDYSCLDRRGLSRTQEGQYVRVDGVSLGRRHAVRKALVGFQRA